MNTEIVRVRIANHEEALFDSCWELYVSAFPEEERRGRSYQIETLGFENYCFEALFHGDEHIGLVGWWNLGTHVYIEHLAIFDHCRSSGYGRLFLSSFIESCESPIILEVEPVENALQQRRIDFYERLNFQLNAHQYAQPPYAGEDFVELLVMTYPDSITAEELESFKRCYFPSIHFRYYRSHCVGAEG